jgi:hypothetical protein
MDGDLWKRAGTPPLLRTTTSSGASTEAGMPVLRSLGVHYVAVSLPQSWYATSRALTPVTAPGMYLAVASFPFPRDPRLNGCESAGTLAKMQPAGALVYVIDGSESMFSSRPKPFGSLTSHATSVSVRAIKSVTAPPVAPSRSTSHSVARRPQRLAQRRYEW